jgi:hypothetical protein
MHIEALRYAAESFVVPGRNHLGYRFPNPQLRSAHLFCAAALGVQEFVSLDVPARHFVPDKLTASGFGFGSADLGQHLIGFRVAELNNKTESLWQSLPFN